MVVWGSGQVYLRMSYIRSSQVLCSGGGYLPTFVPHFVGFTSPWRRFVSGTIGWNLEKKEPHFGFPFASRWRRAGFESTWGVVSTVWDPVCSEQSCSICREEAVTTRRSYWLNGVSNVDQLPPPRSSPHLRQGVSHSKGMGDLSTN